MLPAQLAYPAGRGTGVQLALIIRLIPRPSSWEGPDAIEAVWNSQDLESVAGRHPTLCRCSTTSTWHLGRRCCDNADRWSLAVVLHAGTTNGSGPSWVASVVNKIGQSKYWNDTAIFVTWDDWGGWYDPIMPQIYNSYELGFRYPLLVISPYAKRHSI